MGGLGKLKVSAISRLMSGFLINILLDANPYCSGNRNWFKFNDLTLIGYDKKFQFTKSKTSPLN